jgi:hypothetical protein
MKVLGRREAIVLLHYTDGSGELHDPAAVPTGNNPGAIGIGG